MTNLRLPGQYDERLFAQAGITGLQGPYYNWNRWYLPSLGRYLELDPIAMAGGFNSPFTPDWYSYGLNNPLSFYDPYGLQAVTPLPVPPVAPPPPAAPPTWRLGPIGWAFWFGWQARNLWDNWNSWRYPGTPPWLPKPPRPQPDPFPGPDPAPMCGGPKGPRDDCYEQYKKCMDGPVGLQFSDQSGLTQCGACAEMCIQDNGHWPTVHTNGKPCQ